MQEVLDAKRTDEIKVHVAKVLATITPITDPDAKALVGLIAQGIEEAIERGGKNVTLDMLTHCIASVMTRGRGHTRPSA